MEMDWLEICLVAFIVAMASLLGGCLCFVVYCGADELFLSSVTSPGVILATSFEPQHEELIFSPALKTYLPQTVPDTWYLDVKTPDGEATTSISNAPWSWEQQGCTVQVTYSVGRFSKHVIIDAISDQ